MKTSLKTTCRVVATVLAACLLGNAGQAAEAEKAVKKVVRQYYRAMGERDVDRLRAILNETILVIEAGNDSGVVHVVNTTKDELLPPSGNDDWEGLVISKLKVDLTGSNESVATASYTITHPISFKKREFMEESLEYMPEGPEKKATERLLSEGLQTRQVAMLALQAGRWRIVSISVPK